MESVRHQMKDWERGVGGQERGSGSSWLHDPGDNASSHRKLLFP